MEPSLIISIIGLIISMVVGGFSIYTNVNNQKMKKREEARIEEDRKKKIFDERPQLKIDEFSTNYLKDGSHDLVQKCDIEMLLARIEKFDGHDFHYSRDVSNPENWDVATYRFVNTGKSEITHIQFATNLVKTSSLFSVTKREHLILPQNGCLNYTVILDKMIKPGESFSVKINMIKKDGLWKPLSAELTIWLFDVYKHVWAQPLFIHEGKIYDSKQESMKQYRELTDVATAEQCFANPMLW